MAKEPKGPQGMLSGAESSEPMPAAPAEPKIPFAEFAQEAGLDPILLAGFRADWLRRGEPSHRARRDWEAAYQAFAARPA